MVQRLFALEEQLLLYYLVVSKQVGFFGLGYFHNTVALYAV
jgi:hypothetical protein